VYIHPDASVKIQTDMLPVNFQPRPSKGFIQCRKCAAQGGTGVGLVIFRPEQGCKRIAAMALAGDSEVRHERSCLACIKVDDLTVTLYAWWAKQK
jgi:hypothetical protein